MQGPGRESMKREHFAGPWGRGGRSEPPPADDAPAWLIGALPDDWFTERPEITIDRDEILIIGRLPEPALGEDASPAERASAEAGRIASWREATRARRIGLARQAELLYRIWDVQYACQQLVAPDEPIPDRGETAAYLRSNPASERRWYWTVGDVDGFAEVSVTDGQSTAWLDLYVAPDARGRGAGRA